MTDDMEDIDPSKNVRSAKEIKHTLLKKAIAEGRGHEMIKLILWRLAQIKHDVKKDEDAITEARYMEDQPQSIRALNALAFHKNSDKRFALSEDTATDGKYIHPSPELVN